MELATELSIKKEALSMLLFPITYLGWNQEWSHWDDAATSYGIKNEVTKMTLPLRTRKKSPRWRCHFGWNQEWSHQDDAATLDGIKDEVTEMTLPLRMESRMKYREWRRHFGWNQELESLSFYFWFIACNFWIVDHCLILQLIWFI
jgi:hypothetical protein